MDDKIKEVMGLVRKMGDADFWAGSFAARGDKEGELSKVAESSNLERAIESKLRELVQIPPGYAFDASENQEEQDDDDDFDHCPHCDGTGEGRHEGQICPACKGKGY